ncbi:M23 family metallopeptidase [Agromyces sp. MMS24-JH15]|uniref:M23 family metallopeptidase n=1 Tax=Agromyces sp. MMS24-JH15 TaxID=3243765 RepID=UPI003749EECE
MDRTAPTRESTSRRGIRRLTAVLAAAALAVALPIVAPSAPPAQAATYPTWEELQAAKANTAAANQAVATITSLIAGLEVQVAQTRAEAERRTDLLIAAQQRYDDAVRRADEIQAQADASAAEAEAAKRNAAQVAGQLYRAGGSDLTVELLFDAGDAQTTDALLARLGSMDKMVERTSSIYRQANEKANTARSLGEQAGVARAERERLRLEAEAALQAALEAQAAAEAALAESQAKKTELEAQLAFLKDVEAKTSAAYEEGERIRREEEARRAEEERRRREEAMRSGSAGAVQTSGWARPAAGRITSGYGARGSICTGGGCSNTFHYAVDLGTGCYAPIYAANSGIVRFSGWSGTYGNYIQIDHGGGIWTGYAHIVDGGRYVGVGQWVDAGQNIAETGSTGVSTACHLHFEVWSGGSRINPISFMADRGVDFQ